MDLKKLISGCQFWSLIAVLLILLGTLLIVGHPKEEAAPAPPPLPEDDVKVLVLNYHMVNSMYISLSIEPEDFDWQMKYLVEHGYHTISPDDLYDFLAGQGTLPDRPVLITFDDGYVDNYTNAYPILKKYNLKATIFVVTGFLSKRKGYLTWDQLREMEQNGIAIESHTVTHAPLPDLPDERIREELVESKRRRSWGIRSSSSPIRRACTICISSGSHRKRGIRAALRSSTAMWIGRAMYTRLSACPSSAQRRRMQILSIVCALRRISHSSVGRGTEKENSFYKNIQNYMRLRRFFSSQTR